MLTKRIPVYQYKSLQDSCVLSYVGKRHQIKGKVYSISWFSFIQRTVHFVLDLMSLFITKNIYVTLTLVIFYLKNGDIGQTYP